MASPPLPGTLSLHFRALSAGGSFLHVSAFMPLPVLLPPSQARFHEQDSSSSGVSESSHPIQPGHKGKSISPSPGYISVAGTVFYSLSLQGLNLRKGTVCWYQRSS